MIVKTATPPTSPDRLRRAGYEAERQMAFYLKRAYGTDPAVHVLHNLRLEHAGEVAQIDHLVLHRCGMVLLESKSVTTRVRVNERQEWQREYGGQFRGMPSPVLQAERQVAVLRSLLFEHVAELLDKMVMGMFQKYFAMLPIDVLVAISDGGVIEHKGSLEHVCKADQIPGRLEGLLKDHRQLNSPLNLSRRALDKGMTLSPAEFARVSAFLRTRHRDPASSASVPGETAPSRPQATEPRHPEERALMTPRAASPVQVTVQHSEPPPRFGSFACKHCSSERIQVVYGKYGYYFKCDACAGNTPLGLIHPSSGEKLRVRKQGRAFYAEREQDDFSVLFFTNPPAANERRTP